jgi:hypothetical protein
MDRDGGFGIAVQNGNGTAAEGVESGGIGITEAADRDRLTLAELEEIIERSRRPFMEAGRALREIRERKLYREGGFQTFADYCKTRWGFSDRYARYLMCAARIGTVVPVSCERRARELVPALAELVKRYGDSLDSHVLKEALRRHQYSVNCRSGRRRGHYREAAILGMVTSPSVAISRAITYVDVAKALLQRGVRDDQITTKIKSLKRKVKGLADSVRLHIGLETEVTAAPGSDADAAG